MQRPEEPYKLLAPFDVPAVGADRVEVATASSAALRRTVLEPAEHDRPPAHFARPDLRPNADDHPISDAEPPALCVVADARPHRGKRGWHHHPVTRCGRRPSGSDG